MKETTELFAFLAKLVNATYKANEDGNFKLPEDLQHYFNALFSAPEAFKGLNQIGTEAAKSTVADKIETFDQVAGEMTAVGPDDRSDIVDFLKGNFSIYRLAKRKGFEEGRQSAFAEMRAKKK